MRLSPGVALAGLALCALVGPGRVAAQDRAIRTGRVTYVTGTTCYTSLGSARGIGDSTLVFVVAGSDTVGVLQVDATSSASSACTVLRSTRRLREGDEVVAFVPPTPAEQSLPPAAAAASPVEPITQSTPAGRGLREDGFDVRGRISAQVYLNRYDTPEYNLSQPGLVVSLRGRGGDLPVSFEVYGNARTLSRGTAGLWGGTSENQSRLYRLSGGYDDGTTIVHAGRMSPVYTSSFGSVDGLLFTHRLGEWSLGTTFGYQPDYDYRGTATDFTKFALFAAWAPPGLRYGFVSAAYARNYFQGRLNREIAGLQTSLAVNEELSFFGNAEIDLRRRVSGAFELSPQLVLFYGNVAWRPLPLLSIGVGGDASRPQYEYATTAGLPDSVFDRTIRGGLSLSLSVSFPMGITLSNTFSPRSSQQAFGREYTDQAWLSIPDIASSGVFMRTRMNFGSSAYTRTLGYGLYLQRSFLEMFDLGFRYDRYTYTVRQFGDEQQSSTIAGDLMISISRAIALSATYEQVKGYGMVSRSLFADISYRF